MQENFEILIIQGGVLVQRVQGADPYQAHRKTGAFIRGKYGPKPEEGGT